MADVVVVLANNFEEIEAVSIIDILRRAEISVETMSVSGDKQVKGAHSIFISADALIDDVDFSASKMLVLPGGPGAVELAKNDKILKLVKEFNAENKFVAAICAAPMILGVAGVLKNVQAACYPGFEEYLEGAMLCANRVVVDKNIITSKGPGTAMEFGVKLVEVLKNKREAYDINSAMIARQ